MTTKINGKNYEISEKHETAIEVIRETAELTGTKLVCGQGVCGACTVLVDDVPTVSCLCPAHHLEGKTVQTVEAHDENNLHPVQKAFMACDGLQCGFCTPGFINESIAFYDNWRKEHGKKAPSKKEIANAMSGHLCRCGAYVNIYEAIEKACTGVYDEGDLKEFPRVDALEKVTGKAIYTADVQLDNQLVGRIFRSPHPHAEVLSLDVSEVENMRGVKGVFNMLSEDKIVRYIGHEIVAIAAVDEETIETAFEKIKIEYKVKPGVVYLENARKNSAPEVWGDGKKDPPNASEGPITPGNWEGNLKIPKINLASKWTGSVKRKIAAAKEGNQYQLSEGQWRTAAQIHTALEPHVCVADWQSADKIVVYVSTQSVFDIAQSIADKFDLERENIEVRCTYVGGAFGAKLSMSAEATAAVGLSKAAKLPVKVLLDRAEEMVNGGYRPPAEINVALVADEHQELVAMRGKAYTDSGIGVNSMVATLMRMIYPAGSKDLTDYDVVTNLAAGKPFRGPSAPLTCWALEQAVDGMAEKLNMDPIALRKKWDTHELRQKLYDWAANLPVWKNRQSTGSQTGRYRKGVGVAMGNWFYFYDSDAQVKIETSIGGIKISSATQDMGNGTRTVLARTVAEVLGISANDVIVDIGNSTMVQGPKSGGSRTTASVYAATKKAATKLKRKLEMAASRELKLENVQLEDGQLEHDNGKMSMKQLLQNIEPISVEGKRGTDKLIDLLAMIPMDGDIGKAFSGSVCVSEVEVDTLLGTTKVLNIWNSLAVGKIVVPELALSQCYGAIAQGVGYALYEERVVDANTCNVLTLGLEDYKIAGIGDIPNVNIHFLEEGFDTAQENVVGLAEISKIPIAGSIGNAIFNATGWQPKQLPVRPDHVLEGVAANPIDAADTLEAHEAKRQLVTEKG